ncbi:hypothetical protein GDO78_021373 [Eleutherodactylus coqui]|uniref:Uncharacterized protein n=1 Tax=Eleutherodactylus coqui TaxID=57060 RepID=A0A8J6E9Y2_ELECQ|nr:hypothetical protein GDO78_021373 [Eleutherodactylus coqui]
MSFATWADDKIFAPLVDAPPTRWPHPDQLSPAPLPVSCLLDIRYTGFDQRVDHVIRKLSPGRAVGGYGASWLMFALDQK